MAASAQMSEAGGVDQRVIDFLKKINTGVTGYRRRETEISEEERTVHREFIAMVKRIAGNRGDIEMDDDYKQVTFELAHRGRNDGDFFLELEQESAGTRRLLIVLGSACQALDGGQALCVDELDASLHTQASEAVLELFCIREKNPKGAQLIATTHDTNLMESPMLRRDQVWFTEKDPEGATQLYPLTDIRSRKGDNIQKGYLQGRYGAVPLTGISLNS